MPGQKPLAKKELGGDAVGGAYVAVLAMCAVNEQDDDGWRTAFQKTKVESG
jgi:hypothetical protein